MPKAHKIRYANPQLKFQHHADRLGRAFHRVMEGGQYILGSEVESFENSFAQFTGSAHCVAVNSGTDAITLALKALNIGDGDEVITSGLTAPATVVAILKADAVPVIVDIKPTDLTIDHRRIEEVISKKTKAIVPVHLHGFLADMEQLVDLSSTYGILIVEDCSQAHGLYHHSKHAGTFDQAGTFSFYPTKNLGCVGDGGAIITHDHEIAKKLKSLRYYGFNEESKVYQDGMNSRLDELQAAFLNEFLPSLSIENDQRRRYAKRYHEDLAEFSHWLPPLSNTAVYHQFALRVPKRDWVKNQLEEMGLITGIHYEYAMSAHPSFQAYCSALPNAERLASQLISIPIQPEVLHSHYDKVVDLIGTVLRKL